MPHDFLDGLCICLNFTHPSTKSMSESVHTDFRNQARLSFFIFRTYSFFLYVRSSISESKRSLSVKSDAAFGLIPSLRSFSIAAIIVRSAGPLFTPCGTLSVSTYTYRLPFEPPHCVIHSLLCLCVYLPLDSPFHNTIAERNLTSNCIIFIASLQAAAFLLQAF